MGLYSLFFNPLIWWNKRPIPEGIWRLGERPSITMKNKVKYLELNRSSYVTAWKDQDGNLTDIKVSQSLLNKASALIAGQKEVVFSYQTSSQRFWIKLEPKELQSWEKVSAFLANHDQKMREDKEYYLKWEDKPPKLPKKLFSFVKKEVEELLTYWMESNPSIRKSLQAKARLTRATISLDQIPSFSSILEEIEG